MIVCNTTLGYDAGVGVVAWTDVCQLQLSADEPLPTLSSCLGFSCGVLERCRLDGPCTAATLLARPPVALETGLHSTLRGLQIRCKRRVGRYEAIGYVHCVLPRSQQNTLVTSTLHLDKLPLRVYLPCFISFIKVNSVITRPLDNNLGKSEKEQVRQEPGNSHTVTRHPCSHQHGTMGTTTASL